MQSAEPTMDAIMRPPANTVTPDTPLDDARQIFIAETLRSMIVVDQDRPVGIVSWAEISALNEPAPGKTVADAMTRNTPTIPFDAPISAGRSMLESTDHDLIPVVDERGTLVGEVLRREMLSPGQTVAQDMPARSGQDLKLEPGMEVQLETGDHAGTVENIVADAQGRITHIDVSTGRLLKHRKRIPVDLVRRIEDQFIILGIDKDELKRLPDV
jgi:CBS domain-containing protein/sporulation protein YlmC with PRC-barrel domain